MFLTKLEIADFLGITSATIDFGPLTLLYGPNGAGKSSALDAILHAATGDVVRHEVVAGCIREGAKVASIDAHFAGGSIRREITRKGRAVFVDGVELAAKDAAPEIARILPASQNALRAALQSGAILDLKPAELQALIASVTGAADTKPELDVAPFARLGIDVPGRLAEFDAATKRAVDARKDAKRTLEDRQQQLAGQPAVHGALAARCEATTKEAVEARVRDLQRQRDAAAGQSGARAERRADVEARLAALPPALVPDVEALEATHYEASRAVVRAEEASRAIVREILALEKLAAQQPETQVSIEVARQRATEAETELARAQARVAAKRTEGAQVRAIIDGLKAGGAETCPHCTQAIPAGLIASLEARREALLSEHAALVEAEAAAVAAKRVAVAEYPAAQRAQDVREAQEKLAAVRARKPSTETAYADAVGVEQRARAALAAGRAVVEQQAERARLVAELARLDAPAPTGDLTQIDADLADARAMQTAWPVVHARKVFTAQVAEQEQRVKDADAVIEALKSARASALTRLSEPFTREANAALAIALPETSVEVHETSDGRSGDGIALVVRQRGEVRPVEALSDGERTRVLYALQYAVVRLAKVPLLLLDRAELVDDAGREAVKKLAARAVGEGIQVVMATSKAAPSVSPSVTAYVIDAGRASRIPAALAA